MGIQFSDLVENIEGEEEIARYNVFKDCLLLMRYYEYLWSKGLTFNYCTSTIFRLLTFAK